MKTVMISGAAAESIGGAIKKPRKTRKSKGGDLTDSLVSKTEYPPIIKVQASTPLSTLSVLPSTMNITKVSTSLPAPPSFIPPLASSASLVQDGDRKFRVELKKKPHRKTVHLHPKKPDAQKAPLKKIQTKKNRKVLLGVSSMHKRMTRAKKVHTKIKEMPLDKLKLLLISKKLIKATSKAPESVLRQIAVDADIVAQNAL